MKKIICLIVLFKWFSLAMSNDLIKIDPLRLICYESIFEISNILGVTSGDHRDWFEC